MASVDVVSVPRFPGRLGFPGRLRFWRSPDGQPAWARPALLGIAALAAVLYAWRIRDSGFALFYSVAAKSMSVSWKAFFYGALDPGATITIDKLAGSFIPQALSARIFGYHAWSLTLPQVIEGVIAVLAMYRIGRRWFGAAAGLLAAALFGLTPVVASMFGHPMEDGLLTVCLVLAADAFQRAVLEARLRSLVLAGVWVGVGFQAKMLQAWIILPALVLTYLIAAPTSMRRRLGHLAVAGAVMLAVSLSWVGLYTVTPSHDRPYVDGSTDNSAVAMVFGYNGLDRFGVHVPGAAQSMFSGGGSGGPGGPPGANNAAPGGNQNGGWTKLVGSRYAAQVGWLYPLALLSLVAGLVMRRRAPRADPLRAGYLLWGLWLVTFAVVFSKIMIPHTAYMASLAPALAALSAGGIVQAWRGYRNGTARWTLPALVVVEVAWTLYLAAQYPTFLPWLPWLAAGVGAVSVAVLAAASLIRRPDEGMPGQDSLAPGQDSLAPRADSHADSHPDELAPRRSQPGSRPGRVVLAVAMVLAVAAMVAVPSGWAASVLDSRYGGSAFDASAGPVSVAGPGGFGGARQAPGADIPPQVLERFAGGGAAPAGGGAGPFGGTSATLDSSQQRIYRYLAAHREGAHYLVATDSWNTAGPYILATGENIMPMGGFSGSVPHPTLSAAQALVHKGQLHFFLLSASGGGFGPGRGTGGTVSAIATWVRSTCAEVPAEVYGAQDGSGTGGPGGFEGRAGTLYWCAAA